MITGKTQNLAVIGCPIAHSLSPAMQGAAIAAAGVDFAYIALKILPEDLAAAVTGLRVANFRGFNVTIPHKTAIMPLLDAVTDDAKKIGAVNTVVNDDGFLTGYNTDAEGFTAGLYAFDAAARGKVVALLGAGGAARAVLHALIKDGAAKIFVGARNADKAAALAADFAAVGDVGGTSWESADFAEVLTRADLIVNATPLGMGENVAAMPPVDWQKTKSTAVAYDLIYTPAETLFLRKAKDSGHKIINGEYMLAAQGAAAFKLWTGHDADISAMKNTLRKCLSE